MLSLIRGLRGGKKQGVRCCLFCLVVIVWCDTYPSVCLICWKFWYLKSKKKKKVYRLRWSQLFPESRDIISGVCFASFQQRRTLVSAETCETWNYTESHMIFNLSSPKKKSKLDIILKIPTETNLEQTRLIYTHEVKGSFHLPTSSFSKFERSDGLKSLLINVFFFMPLTSRSVTWCLPGVGHALHGDLRGACNHARVPGRDDDGRGDGVCWTADI